MNRTLRRVLLACACLFAGYSHAQTTIATGLTAPTATTGRVLTFGVQNTNTYPIQITEVANYHNIANNGATYTLWYTSTQLTDTPNIVSPDWTAVGTGAPITTAATGLTTVLTGLNLVVPAGTTYRLALQLSATPGTAFYTNTSSSSATSFAGGGVNLLTGSNATLLGFAGAFPRPTSSPRWFGGSITFYQTGTCTNPPVAGTTTINGASTPLTTCAGNSINLNLSGFGAGIGQTYQWQFSTTAAFAAPTNVGSALFAPTLSTTVTAAGYYRAAVTCNSITSYSTPLQVSLGATLSGTYTINSGAAASATNFTSFNAAVTALSGGCGVTGPVVFNVVSGAAPYNEQVILPQIAGVSATNTITFNGNGATLSFNSTNANERAVLKLNGADFVTVRKLNIAATGTTASSYGYAVQLLNDADNNVFDSCTISCDTTLSSQNYTAFAISGSATSAQGANSQCDSNTISNCSLIGGYNCVTIVGNGTTAQVYNNRLLNSDLRNAYAQPTYFNGTNGLLVQNNRISRATRTNGTDFAGIYLLTGCTGTTVERNRIFSPFAAQSTNASAAVGIYVAADGLAASPNIFRNNLVYGFTGAGVQYGIQIQGAGNYSKFYHNTISLDDAAATCVCETRAVYYNSTSAGVEFKDNIFNVTRGGIVNKYGLYVGTAGAAFSARNNLYNIRSTATGVTNAIGSIIGTDYLTLPAWQAGSGQDTGSLDLVPQFTNAAGGNFLPTANFDNLGTPVGVGNDLLNASRSASTPDIGAYEFTTPACTGTPVAGTPSANVTTTCAGSPVLLSLTGNSVGSGQTYQWQSSTTSGGTYANVGSASPYPNTTVTPAGTLYYRVAVTCGSNTVNSAPVLITVNPGNMAGSYSINSAQATGGTNFQTFAAAVNALKCGISNSVIFNVAAGSGPYVEQINIPQIPGASASKTITFNCSGVTLNFASYNENERAGLKLNGADFVTVNNLTIASTGGNYLFGIQLTAGADSNVINGCTVDAGANTTNTEYAPFVMSGSANSSLTNNSESDGNLISNNTFTGGNNGIILGGNVTTLSTGNRIVNNIVKDFYSNGINCSWQTRLVVSGNEVFRTARTTFTGTYGIALNNVVGADISRNRIHDPFAAAGTSSSSFYGLYENNSDGTAALPNVVSNNQLYNIRSTGTIAGIYNLSSDNFQHYYNTLALDDATTTSTATVYGFYQTALATGLRFFNNIVTMTRPTGTKYFYFYVNPSLTQGNTNVLFNGSTTGTNYIGNWNGTNYSTLAAWTAATTTSLDTNSVQVDPVYTAASTGNLTPTAAAVGNIGTPQSVTTDINGSTRSATTPDPGSIEWPIAACAAPTGLTAASITTTSATLSWTAVTGAAGYEYVIDFVPNNPVGSGTATTAVSVSATGLNTNTTYYLHVRTNCGSSYSTWSTISFTTLCPAAPTGLLVSSITPSSANVSWAPVTGAYGYQYAVTTSSTPPTSGTFTTTNNVNVAGLTYNTLYYLHVRTSCVANSFSTWSSTSFTTACQPTSNLSATNITSTSADVSWTAVANVVNYEYAVTTSSTPPASGTLIAAPAASVSGLTPITNYYLHVRVRCSATNVSDWMSFPFTTACASIVATSTANGPTTFCSGGSVQLTANSATGVTYQWLRNNAEIIGATSITYTATQSGDYSVQVRTSPLCAATSAPVTVTAVPIPVATIQPSPGFVCSGSSLMLYAVSAPGYTYQWRLNGNPIQGAVANSLTLSAPGSYTVVVTNAGLCTQTSAARVISLSNPQLVSATGGYTCGPGAVTLSATPTANATVRWFATATSGYPLATGNTFTTPTLTATTNYYLSATEGYSVVGPTSPTAVAPANTTSAATSYQTFNVTAPVTLLSVDVFPTSSPAGTAASIEIRDSVGAIVATVPYTTTATSGQRQTVGMNVSLLPGIGYRMKQGTAISLAAGTGAVYPYTSPNVTITGQNTTTATQFLGFFNWQLATGCESPRQLVQAVVDPGPGATITPGPQVKVCSGQSVTLQANSAPSLTYQWYKDGTAISSATSVTYQANATGTYSVKVASSICSTTSSNVVVTVVPLPVPVITSANNTNLTTTFYDTYQWYRNGVQITGATGQSYPAPYDGQYTVRVRDLNGCYGTSAAFTVNTLKVGSGSAGDEVVIYPNPASSKVYVNAGGRPVSIRIAGMDGRMLLRSDRSELDIHGLAPGLYLVSVYDSEGRLLKMAQVTKVD